MVFFNCWIHSFNDLFWSLSIWEIVFVQNFSNSFPVFNLIPKLIRTVWTNVLDFCGLTIAFITEVVEEDNYLEVLRNNLVFVLSYVFRTELELWCLNVITPLNKCRVKHNSAKSVITESAVFKQYFNITVKRPAFALFSRQYERCFALFAEVPSFWMVRED